MTSTAAKGFSMIELLIVIAIMTILTVIGTSSFAKYRQNAALKEAVYALEADLNAAKLNAIAQRTNYRVTYNAGTNTYRIQGGTYDVTKKLSDYGYNTRVYMLLYFPSTTSYTFTARGVMLENPTTCTTTATNCYFDVLIRNQRGSCIHVRVTHMGSVKRWIHQII